MKYVIIAIILAALGFMAVNKIVAPKISSIKATAEQRLAATSNAGE